MAAEPTHLIRADALAELALLARELNPDTDNAAAYRDALEVVAAAEPVVRVHILADLMVPDGQPHVTVWTSPRSAPEGADARARMLARIREIEGHERAERSDARQRFLGARLPLLEGAARSMAEREREDLDRRLKDAAESIIGSAVAVVASTLAVEGRCGPEHYDAALVMCWPGVLQRWIDRHAPTIAATEVVADTTGSPDPAAVAELNAAVLAILDSARRAIYSDASQPNEERGDLLAIDARAAAHVATLGRPGSPLRQRAEEAAELIREAGRERLATWRAQSRLADAAPPWARWRDLRALATMLARLLWCGEVGPGMEARRAKPPGLPFYVARSIARAATPGLALDGSIIVRPHPAKPRSTVSVAALPASATESLVHVVQAGFRDIGGRFALPLVESVITAAHARFLDTGDPVGARFVTIEEGGWDRVARDALEIREVHPEVRGAVRRIALALAHMPLEWIDGARSSSLWLVDESAAAAGRGRSRARIVFTLSERAAWGEVFRGAAGQRIVPLPRPRNIDPIPGSPRNTFGPQAAFLRLLWLHFAERSAELTASGALVTVGDDARARLADEAQLIRRLVSPLLDHFVRVGAVVGGGDTYAPADKAALAFLRDGAARGTSVARTEAVRAKRATRARR